MSMNLNACCKEGTIELWQTPTQISYTILPSGSVKGKKAVEALERYKAWVRYSINGVYSSQEAVDYAKDNIDRHLKYIESFDLKGLELWVM